MLSAVYPLLAVTTWLVQACPDAPTRNGWNEPPHEELPALSAVPQLDPMPPVAAPVAVAYLTSYTINPWQPLLVLTVMVSVPELLAVVYGMAI